MTVNRWFILTHTGVPVKKCPLFDQGCTLKSEFWWIFWSTVGSISRVRYDHQLLFNAWRVPCIEMKLKCFVS